MAVVVQFYAYMSHCIFSSVHYGSSLVHHHPGTNIIVYRLPLPYSLVTSPNIKLRRIQEHPLYREPLVDSRRVCGIMELYGI